MSNTDFNVPLVITASGPVPTPPATLRADLLAAVSAVTPGYTANLPFSMIDDVASTQVGGLAVCDSARVETLNSISPLIANPFMLSQLGQLFIGPGAAPAPPTNTSVTVLFTVKNTLTSSVQPGFSIPVGFTVSDGQFQYVVQDGGVSDSNGNASLFCISPQTGTWSVAPGSVTNVVTSVPNPYAVTCTNPIAGNTSTTSETQEDYRGRVGQACQAVSQGMPSMLKTLVGQVPGVTQRLIGVEQQGSGWKVLVGGGDPYLVAGAIYDALFDISTLVGSVLNVTNITQANPGVITTALNHGLAAGQTAQVTGITTGMTQINSLPGSVTIVSENQFSIGINTLGFSPYVSGGVVTPNNRNQTPNIIDYPDTYSVPFVQPLQQTVTMTITYNTTKPNFVQQASVAQKVAPAIAAYINSIFAGAQPINLLVAGQVFTTAVAGILLPDQISELLFSIFINGVLTAPQAGTSLVFGDPESYFTATSGGISVVHA